MRQKALYKAEWVDFIYEGIEGTVRNLTSVHGQPLDSVTRSDSARKSLQAQSRSLNTSVSEEH